MICLRSYRVTRWNHEVRVSGLVGGWTRVLFLSLCPFVWLSLLIVHAPIYAFAGWLALATLLALHRFEVRVQPDTLRYRESILGIPFSTRVFDTSKVVIELDDDTPEEAVFPGGVVIYHRDETAISTPPVGDDFNAFDLRCILRAALATAQNDADRAATLVATTLPAPPPPAAGETWDAERVMRTLTPYFMAGMTLLVAEGWQTLEEKTVRVTGVRCGFFVVQHPFIKLRVDQYLSPEELESVVARLNQQTHVIRGGWDEMAFTKYRRYTWSAKPFRVWRRGRLIASLDGTWLEFAPFGVSANEVVKVSTWVSESWSKIGVRVHLKDGTNQLLTWRWNTGLMDPFYDGIDLMFDTSWASDIARSLADELDVDYEDET